MTAADIQHSTEQAAYNVYLNRYPAPHGVRPASLAELLRAAELFWQIRDRWRECLAAVARERLEVSA